MRRFYKIARAMVVAMLVLLLAVPAALYVALSLPVVQDMVARRAESELSALLGTGVSIGRVSIEPFNRVTLSEVAVLDPAGTDALRVGTLGAGIDLYTLIVKRRIVVTYAEIIDMKARIYRDTPDSPLNIQPIIDHLKPKDKNKPPTKFDLAVNMVLIRRSSATYDVLSAPKPQQGRFDPMHVAVDDLNADIDLPRLKNDDFVGRIRRLTARERSGLTLTELRGDFTVTATGATATDVVVKLPRSLLALQDMEINYRSFASLGEDLRKATYDLGLRPGSHVTPADLSPLLPPLASVTEPVNLEVQVMGTLDAFTIPRFRVEAQEGRVKVQCDKARVSGLTRGAPAAEVKQLSVNAVSADILKLATLAAALPDQAVDIISRCGNLALLVDAKLDMKPAQAKGSPRGLQAMLDGTVTTDAGTLDIDADYQTIPSQGSPRSALRFSLSTEGFDPSALLQQTGGVGQVALEAEGDVTLGGKRPTGSARLEVASIDWRGRTFKDIRAEGSMDQDKAHATLSIDDPAALLKASGDLTFGSVPELELEAQVDHFDLSTVLTSGKLRNYALSLSLDASALGRNLDTATGWLTLAHGSLIAPDGTAKTLEDLTLEVRNELQPEEEGESTGRVIELRSPIIDGRVTGDFLISQLPRVARDIFLEAYPVLAPAHLAKGSQPATLRSEGAPSSHLAFDFSLKSDSLLSTLVPLPVSLLDTVKITGQLNSAMKLMSLQVFAPYLAKGNKLIEDTRLTATICGGEATVVAGTTMPSKFGPMTLSLNATGARDTTSLSLGWHMKNQRRYGGRFDIDAALSRKPGSPLDIDARFLPTDIAINDTVWQVSPSTIEARADHVTVDGFSISRPGQYIRIDGTASADSTQAINLSLRDIDLDYVFETLNIPNVAFGGRATGDFIAARLFSGAPVLSTTGEGLKVENLSYNHCVMGDGVVQSAWHPENQGITIDAVITEKPSPETEGQKPPQSIVHGLIRPMAEELDFRFEADRVPVGFMQPFMSAFTSKISGRASGKAHLYGTFSLLDMVGDIYAQDLHMRLDFTNTTYVVTDSVHMSPGLIKFRNVKMADRYGNTASVSGQVTHKCFKEPTFDFDITQARNLLVYDVPAGGEDPWYGRIFGNGSAKVRGVPGLVDIRVNMATSKGVPGAGSDFTFVLSDSEVAEEYGFITFRDVDQARKDSLAAIDDTPPAVKLMRAKVKKANEDTPSVYKMDFNVDVTPDTRMNLVMDPIGGDVITAYGNGHIRMTYDSDGELRMFGDYVLDRGSYLFTLQDIIKKYFTIRAGSSISFKGDPYAARLNITAQYDVRTNLTDLDESFASDRELNSTVVNVQALLRATGDMRSPDISFDLDFPLLSDEMRRKVRSIISTDDMMNRQIIYLLGLGRFYTPDYTNASRGNELASLASSTISSQLASMLGQISDNWTISPQFRSDKGDFSDMEVDVALSSHLLNNRLLLNGNLGYRDKSLNTNTFVGDFDIEYLLNRSGSIRLKAYNHYNDQSYYLKSALTTQGVGIVYKRDFDNMFRFLRRRKPREPRDTTVVVTDSLLIFK